MSNANRFSKERELACLFKIGNSLKSAFIINSYLSTLWRPIINFKVLKISIPKFHKEILRDQLELDQALRGQRRVSENYEYNSCNLTYSISTVQFNQTKTKKYNFLVYERKRFSH